MTISRSALALAASALLIASCGSDEGVTAEQSTPTATATEEPGTGPESETAEEPVEVAPSPTPTVDLDEPQPGDEEVDDDLPEFEEELDEGRQDAARADLELAVADAPVAASPGEAFVVTVLVTSLDSDFVNAPTVVVALPDGMSPGPETEECEATGSELRCQVALSLLSETGEVPVSAEPYDIALEVDVGAVAGPAALELWAESLDNPIDNDPDPANNRVEIEISVS